MPWLPATIFARPRPTPRQWTNSTACWASTRLRCFHFNDSKKGLGSHVDRHDHIGTGELGLAPFGFILNDPRFADVPKILETPKSEDMHEDVENLRVLRTLIEI